MTATSIIAPTTPGSLFSWDAGKGVAFASSLGFRPGQVPGYRIYNDAMDHGFIVESQRTGKTVGFTLAKEVTDGDGGVSAWEYTSTGGNLSLVVFND